MPVLLLLLPLALRPTAPGNRAGFSVQMVQPTTRPGDGGAARPPAVAAPAGFVAPKPKPLSMTRPKEQLPSLITGGLALAVRLATGVFTLGWTPRLLTGDDAAAVGVESGTYGFRLGPVAFRDTSPLLAEAVRPEEPLVLYEYEGSPFCRKARGAALLHLPPTH